MRILMLEDDLVLAELVSSFLLLHLRIDTVNTIEEARLHLEQVHYDVILLDRNINGVDIGLELIEEIKTKNPMTGVIVISAYDSISDKIEGLNLGADDYLDKPFDYDELLARIYVQARKNRGLPQFSIDGLLCNTIEKSIVYKEEELHFSKKESNLLFYLLQKRGTIVSKDELLDALYINPQNISSNTIDVTIRNIRKKLPINIIKTIKTRGYFID
ncbi:MAG: response regulator transcription factor [Campylobacterales bacterium]|nr:response regulator transcription factor [Campylobacterales bacterium]